MSRASNNSLYLAVGSICAVNEAASGEMMLGFSISNIPASHHLPDATAYRIEYARSVKRKDNDISIMLITSTRMLFSFVCLFVC